MFHDGEAPADDDVLFGIGFTRSLPAIVDEFRPRTLGNLYKAKLEARLLAISGPNPELHPLALYEVPVPFVFDSPQAIDVLETPVGKQNWVQAVLNQVTALYYALTPEEQAAVNPQVIEPLFLVEPFVDSVLQAFTHSSRTGRTRSRCSAPPTTGAGQSATRTSSAVGSRTASRPNTTSTTAR